MTAAPAVHVVFLAYQSGLQADGGVESITQLIEALPDMERSVFTQRSSDFTRRWSESGAAVRTLDARGEYPSLARRLVAYARGAASVARHARGSAARLVIHCNDIKTLPIGLAAAAFLRCPVLLSIRDVKPEGVPYSRKWRHMTRRCSAVVVLSGDMRARLLSRGALDPGKAQHVVPIYSPVAARGEARGSGRSEARARLGLPQTGYVVLVVGAFVEKKQQLDIIRSVIPGVARSLPDVLVCFLGDFEPGTNAYAARCQAAADDPALAAHVRFVGYVADMATWRLAADVTLVGSTHEGLARAMIESLAAGVPVVSTDVCSAREILEQHHCGLVAGVGRFDGLADALVRLARDPGLRGTLSANARETARLLFAPERAALAHRRLYERLLQAK